MWLIAWDVDDVLNDLMRCWLEIKWLPEHQNCCVTFEELTVNPPYGPLQITLAEYLTSLDQFRLSDKYMKMKPNTEILRWLSLYGNRYRHMALTAVPAMAVHNSASWVMKHFHKWIRCYHFIPSIRHDYKVPEYDASKAEYLHSLACPCVLVDDSPANVRSCKEMGIRAYLWPKPWNNAEYSIQEIFEELSGLTADV